MKHLWYFAGSLILFFSGILSLLYGGTISYASYEVSWSHTFWICTNGNYSISHNCTNPIYTQNDLTLFTEAALFGLTLFLYGMVATIMGAYLFKQVDVQ